MHVEILILVDNILHMHFLTALNLLGMPFQYMHVDISILVDDILHVHF